MKILHIVAGDLTGGAARGAYWLHQGLIDLGIESKVLTNSKVTFNDSNVISVNNTKKKKLLNFIRFQIDSGISSFYKKREKRIFSIGLIGFDFIKTNEYKKADIIHLHWINGGFIDMKTLSKINKPMVWTMRDMWPMTGGCHYTMGCENFINGCGNCEQLNSNFKYDLSKFILNRKKKYLPKNMKIVGISNWLSDEAKKSLIFRGFDIRTISNNINTDEFKPINKDVARKILGITTDKQIILVGSTNLKDFYKGFGKYLEAIEKLDSSQYFLCFFGNLEKDIINQLNFEYKIFGYLNDNISLRLVYSCANVFVAPSLMDAFGKTIAESMVCETPVVCFNASGPKDIVDHKINGYKAEPFNSSDLANGIEWIIENKDYNKLCKNAREKVLKEFDSLIVAKKYIELYDEILK